MFPLGLALSVHALITTQQRQQQQQHCANGTLFDVSFSYMIDNTFRKTQTLRKYKFPRVQEENMCVKHSYLDFFFLKYLFTWVAFKKQKAYL